MDKRILIIVVIVVGVFVYLSFSKKEKKENAGTTGNEPLIPSNNTPNTTGNSYYIDSYSGEVIGTAADARISLVENVVIDTKTGLPVKTGR